MIQFKSLDGSNWEVFVPFTFTEEEKAILRDRKATQEDRDAVYAGKEGNFWAAADAEDASALSNIYNEEMPEVTETDNLVISEVSAVKYNKTADSIIYTGIINFHLNNTFKQLRFSKEIQTA